MRQVGMTKPQPFSDYLRATRARLNVTPAQLADMLGVSLSSIHQWERGSVPHPMTELGVRVTVDKITNAKVEARD